MFGAGSGEAAADATGRGGGTNVRKPRAPGKAVLLSVDAAALIPPGGRPGPKSIRTAQYNTATTRVQYPLLDSEWIVASYRMLLAVYCYSDPTSQTQQIIYQPHGPTTCTRHSKEGKREKLAESFITESSAAHAANVIRWKQGSCSNSTETVVDWDVRIDSRVRMSLTVCVGNKWT